MFDFLRNLTKTEEEKRQETLSAYLDNALTPQERQAFEEQLKNDTVLQAGLEQEQYIKQNINQLPRLRAPRNFTLDPAAYGRPAPQPAIKLYPIMRAATAVAAVMLIFLFSLELFSPIAERSETLAGAPSSTNVALDDTDGTVAQESAAEEPAPAAVPEISSQAANEAAADAEEPMEEAMVGEEVIEEESVEEPVEEESAGEAENAPPAEPEQEEEAGLTGSDGAATITLTPLITTTQRAIPTTTLTPQGNAITNLYSDTQTFPLIEPTTAPDANVTSPELSSRNILQIGLGILFLLLLIATLLLRRQI